jgi:hypothetical protein
MMHTGALMKKLRSDLSDSAARGMMFVGVLFYRRVRQERKKA